MKKIVFSGFVAFCLMLISCQSEKTKVCKIVDDFLKYNDTLSLSEEYKEAYKSCEKIAYLDDYKLIANKYRDSIYRVETAEQVTFFLKKKDGEWKITNSYNFFDLNFNVSIIDSQKDVFWDMKQYEVMKNIKKNLHIYFDNRVKKDGNFAYVNFTIENESDYDISHIEYGYQLLDYYGQIVYSNIGSISELIEKKGRRERSFSKYIGDEFPRFPFYCSGYIIFKSGDYLNQKQ